MKSQREIEIVPLGQVEAALLADLQKSLSDIFRVQVAVNKARPLPRRSFDRARHQYLSPLVIEELALAKVKPEGILLAVTDEDLYTPGLNFVFGQADSRSGVCIISLHRLHPSFYGLPDDRSLFFRRARKEAGHEIGHLLGLGHCPDPRCVMHFSNSIMDTDRKGVRFCENCQKRLS